MSPMDAGAELRRRRQTDALRIIAEGVLVLAKRDGLEVSQELARERANNIVMALQAEGLLR